MNNIDKAKLIIRAAEKDKKNYQKYDKALRAIAAQERKTGTAEAADFILQEMSEALVVATE